MAFEQAQDELRKFLDTLNSLLVIRERQQYIDTVHSLLLAVIDVLLKETDLDVVEKHLADVCPTTGLYKGLSILHLILIFPTDKSTKLVDKSIELVARCKTLSNAGIQFGSLKGHTAFTIAVTRNHWILASHIIEKSKALIDPYQGVIVRMAPPSETPPSETREMRPLLWKVIFNKQYDLAKKILEPLPSFDPNRTMKIGEFAGVTILWSLVALLTQDKGEKEQRDELITWIFNKSSGSIDPNVGPLDGMEMGKNLLWKLVITERYAFALRLVKQHEIKIDSNTCPASGQYKNVTVPFLALLREQYELAELIITKSWSIMDSTLSVTMQYFPRITLLGLALHKKQINIAKQIIKKSVVINPYAIVAVSPNPNRTIWELAFNSQDRELQELLLPYGIDLKCHDALSPLPAIVQELKDILRLLMNREFAAVQKALEACPALIKVSLLPANTSLLHLLIEMLELDADFRSMQSVPYSLQPLIDCLLILTGIPNAFGVLPYKMPTSKFFQALLEPKKSDFQQIFERKWRPNYQLLKQILSKQKALCEGQIITLEITKTDEKIGKENNETEITYNKVEVNYNKDTMEELIEQIRNLLNDLMSFAESDMLIDNELVNKINQTNEDIEESLRLEQEYKQLPQALTPEEVNALQAVLLNLQSIFTVTFNEHRLTVEDKNEIKDGKKIIESSFWYDKEVESDSDKRGEKHARSEREQPEQDSKKILRLN